MIVGVKGIQWDRKILCLCSDFLLTIIFALLQHGDFVMVRQCNFTSWPEHGVPENTTALIHFVKMIRGSRPHENTPTIVHCRYIIVLQEANSIKYYLRHL